MKGNNVNVSGKEQYMYNDPKFRTKKLNHTVMVGVTIVEVLLAFGLAVQVSMSENSYGKMAIAPLAVLVIGMVVNWIVFLKNKSGEKLKYIIVISFLIGWGYLLLTGKNVMIPFYIYPILIATILYHDSKYEKFFFWTVLALNLIHAVIWVATGYMFNGNDVAFISTIVNLEVIIVIHVIAKLSSRFSHDMLYTVKDEQEIQSAMLQDVLRISDNVKVEVDETNTLIDNLKDSSVVVHSSIEEVSARTKEMEDNVQNQTKMTAQISEVIDETAENAKIMVETTEGSAKMVEDSMTVIDNIRNSAKGINETNSRVAVSMEELQEKAKEVQSITEVIFSISSQTNLLALNASIESARAGEAGRGFAVVADQIRNLSEETRKSTEQIAVIVKELNVNAQNATEIVQSSIDAMDQQNHMVEDAADGFKNVRDNIDILAERVENMNDKIENLVRSNNAIIESINQLSGSSEAVSESAREVEERSLQNQTEAEKAKELLNKIQQMVQGFEKYQK